MLTYRVCHLALKPELGWRQQLLRILGAVFPKSDPDFFLAKEPISYWWLEMDDALTVSREIGFTSDKVPVRCAPAFDNWGMFVGEEVTESHLSGEVNQDEFDEAWTKAMGPLIARNRGA